WRVNPWIDAPGAPGHPRQAERNADMVVVAADRTMRGALAGTLERGEDRFLDAGLAHRARDPDDLRGGSLARGLGEKLQRPRGILDQDMRLRDRRLDHRRGGA